MCTILGHIQCSIYVSVSCPVTRLCLLCPVGPGVVCCSLALGQALSPTPRLCRAREASSTRPAPEAWGEEGEEREGEGEGEGRRGEPGRKLQQQDEEPAGQRHTGRGGHGERADGEEEEREGSPAM